MLEETFMGTGRGTLVRAVVHRPEKPRPAAVVLAPGGHYHCEMPILRETAIALEGRGFFAVRFDWAYQTRGLKASASFRDERDDLASIVEEARALPGVRKVVLVGKSLGALLGMELAASAPLAGLALLTVPLAGLQALSPPPLTLPCALITGDADDACPLEALRHETEAGRLPRDQVILPGDHSLHASVSQVVREVVERAEAWLQGL